MADAYLRRLSIEKNLDLKVYSSGLDAQEGEPATNYAKIAISEYGGDLSNHRAQNTFNSNIEDMDIILCATVSHKQILLSKKPKLAGKVYTIKEFAYGNKAVSLDISDPWGYDISVYRHCAKEIVDAINIIVTKL
jgi:protein-tyrosine phosphatase